MQTAIVTTEKMVFGGSCLSEIEGKKIFIPYALPNEMLEISVIKEHKNYCEGKIEKIITPSKNRKNPACPYFYFCGGCNLQMAEDKYQQKLREQMAIEAFCRAFKKEKHHAEFISGKSWEYRSRFQFHLNADKQITLKKQNSKKLICVNDCPIAVPAVRDLLKEKTYDKYFNGNLQKERIHLFSSGNRIFTEDNASSCFTCILNKKINFNPLGFFQSNLEMTEKLIRLMLEEIKPCRRILDFYAGVGTFSLFMLEFAEEIHLLEHNKHALKYAEINLNEEKKRINGNARIFYHGFDSKNWLKNNGSKLKFDIVIIDPPRSGIDKNTLEWLCTNQSGKIIYVSCDPVSFAQNAFKLVSSGYKLEKHYLLDFYPQTHHIETMAVFRL